VFGPVSTREVLQTAAPLLRVLAIAVAPALGRLAVRALAPRIVAALPAASQPRVLPVRLRRATGRGSRRTAAAHAPPLHVLPSLPAPEQPPVDH
jgi:hypothetical protein